MTEQPPQPFSQSGYPSDWSLFVRRVAAILLAAVLVYALTHTGPVLSNVLLAVILTFLLLYPIRLLTKHLRLPYFIAVALTFLTYLGLAIFIAIEVAVPAIAFLGNLAGQSQKQLEQFLYFLSHYTPSQGFVRDPTGRYSLDLNFILLPLSKSLKGENLEEVQKFIPTLFSTLTSTAATTATTISSLFINFLFVHILSIFFLIELPPTYRWLKAITPPAYRREYRILMHRIGRVWVGFFRGALLGAMILGTITWLQFLAMGIPNGFEVGLVTGVASFIPIIGGLLALIPIALVPFLKGSTLLQFDPLTLSLLAFGVNLALQTVLWQVVSPMILGDAVSLPVSVVSLGIAIGASIGGLLGCFLATPAIAISREIIVYVCRKIRGGDPYPDVPIPNSDFIWMFERRLHRSLVIASPPSAATETTTTTEPHHRD